MARKNTANKLNIFLNGQSLGKLEYAAAKNLKFTYHANWLVRPEAFPISRSLPLREDSFIGTPVYAYFDNLLPDAITIRQRIAARMRAGSDQVFDLLAAVGKDCVGALQFIKDDEDFVPKLEEAKGKTVSDKVIATRLTNLKIAPLALTDEDDFRLSIAGVQEKTAFVKLGKRWAIPLDSTPTSHIFKPQIGELKPGLTFTDSVENEWLCSQIAREFGIPVAPCEIALFEDLKVLVVERFDRLWDQKRLIRIPQEDLCQALSIPNFEKYEADGGPGIVKIMNLLYESTQPNEDRALFLKTQIIFFLLAAIDGHAKNFSIRWGPNGFQLTPLYDILSAQPMLDQGKFAYEKVKLAMAIGENRHYKIKEILMRHFLQTAKLCYFDSTELCRILDEVQSEIPTVIDKVSNQIKKGFPQFIADSIFAGIKKRQKLLAK